MSSTSQPQSQPPSKDFSAAFANLQSTYGFSGNAPTPAPMPKSPEKRSILAKIGLTSSKRSTSTSASSSTVTLVPPQTASKEAPLSPELAYAALASKYTMPGSMGGGKTGAM